jgi:hypothetical protein
VVKTALRNVRFGSKADIEARQSDVRFTPKKRTSNGTQRMSAKCQKRTYAVQQKRLFDHLIGGGEQLVRYRDTELPRGLAVDQ